MARSIKAWRKKRQALAAFLLGSFLFLQALAALPALHLWIHPDASDSDHECAVTLFIHGQVTAAATPAPVFHAPQVVLFREAEPKTIFVSADIRLLPSRGPPASLVPA